MSEPRAKYDLLVVGGGINGTGIARDAAGRGLSVLQVLDAVDRFFERELLVAG